VRERERERERKIERWGGRQRGRQKRRLRQGQATEVGTFPACLMCAPLPKVGILWPVKVSGELLVGEARAVAVEHDHHLQGVRPLDAPPRRRAAGAHLPQGERPTLGHAYSRHAGRLHMLSRAWSSALPAATWLWAGRRASAAGGLRTWRTSHMHPFAPSQAPKRVAESQNVLRLRAAATSNRLCSSRLLAENSAPRSGDIVRTMRRSFQNSIDFGKATASPTGSKI
jgi:hypothetical protein